MFLIEGSGFWYFFDRCVILLRGVFMRTVICKNSEAGMKFFVNIVAIWCGWGFFIFIGALLFFISTSSFAGKAEGVSSRQQQVFYHTAFGSAIVFPSIAAAGSVIARYYITPQQVCNQAACSIYAVNTYPNGGSALGSTVDPLISTNVSGVSARILINGIPQARRYQNEGAPFITTSSPLEIQLIRDGRPLNSGSLKGVDREPEYWIISSNGGSVAYGPVIRISMSGSISVIPGTCTVSNQIVSMSPALPTDLKGVGTTTAKHAFNVNLENCPAGFNRVGHLLTAVGGQVAGMPGALKPTAGSTATGVAIKLTDASGAPATFGTSLPVTSYNKTTGGAASIPMSASYVQTGATVSPGAVKGAVQVLLDYQ